MESARVKHESSIRKVTKEDRREYLRMRLALYPEYRPEFIERETDEFLRSQDSLSAAFVADRGDGALGGFAEFVIDTGENIVPRPCGQVASYYVDPDLRRKGVGSALLKAGEQWALHIGCQEMISDCDSRNEASRLTHLANGYNETHRIIHFCKRLG